MRNYPHFIDGETMLYAQRDLPKHTPTDKWHLWDLNQISCVRLLTGDQVVGKAGRMYMGINIYVKSAG